MRRAAAMILPMSPYSSSVANLQLGSMIVTFGSSADTSEHREVLDGLLAGAFG